MIVSVTVDRNKGGIANSLVSYSKALHITGKKHLVMVPKNAHVISDLKELENVKILAISKISLYFHIYTKFFFKPKISKQLKESKWIFIHNSKLLKYLTYISF